MERVVAENRHAFQKFLELCRVATKNDTVVLSLMKQSYDRTDCNYLNSPRFFQLLEACTDRITDDPSNKFVHIRYFINELKPHKVIQQKPSSLRRQSHSRSPGEESDRKRFKAAESTVTRIVSESDAVELVGVQSPSDSLQGESGNIVKVEVVNSSLRCDVLAQLTPSANCSKDRRPEHVSVYSETSLPSTVQSTQIGHLKSLQLMPSSGEPLEVEIIDCTLNDDDTDERRLESANDSNKEIASSSSATAASVKQIRRLEKLLVAIDRQIQKLQEKELTLDEMDDDSSAYLLEDKYKKKFVAVWNKLCELKGVANLTGRPIEKPVKFEGTKYSELNRRISRFVNKYRVFPDFQDIYEIINSCNTKFNLGIKKTSMVSLAREAFMTLGNMLQSRRVKDYMTDFGCHLTDTASIHEDPALKDPTVKEKLKSNRQLGVKRLEEVINKFAEIQEKAGDEDSEDQTAGDENDDSSGKPSCEVSDVESELFITSVESLPHKTSSSSNDIEIIVLDDDSNLPKADDAGLAIGLDFADCNRNFSSELKAMSVL